jgi:zinc/manganese transport system substrate-binding protein
VRVLRSSRPTASILATAVALFATAATMAGCGSGVNLLRTGDGPIAAVGAENEYANVIAQIGGKYVTVTAIESNPNVDPHSFEASPSVARTVAAARLVVQNGLGYDTFMNRIESASPDASRRVIDVQTLLGLPDSSPNPHLWYKPQTMPQVAHAVAVGLSAIAPSHAAYFQANERRFDASLVPWREALAQFAAHYPHTALATTEPVADYMLQAAGTINLTPFNLQGDIMNGVDPAPQDVTLERNLLSEHRVKVLLYNQQVTDSVTQSFLAAARSDRIPIVGIYETMPEPGYEYQSWMLAEVRALQRAVANGVSTERLR